MAAIVTAGMTATGLTGIANAEQHLTVERLVEQPQHFDVARGEDGIQKIYGIHSLDTIRTM